MVLPRLRVVFSFLVLLLFSGPASAATVADYQANFQNPTPATGWEYMWNSGGSIGTAANYSDLVWSSGMGIYNFDGGTGFPRAEPAGYVNLGPTGGHPGRGSQQPDSASNGLDRFAIAKYTMQAGGIVSIENSAFSVGPTQTGDRLQVYVNDILVSSALIPANSGKDFDIGLGVLHAGESVYVAVGSNGVDYSDGFGLGYKVQNVVSSSVAAWNATGAGANGTWDTSTPGDWTASDGSPLVWNNSLNLSAYFCRSGGSVTVGQPVTARSLAFQADGYTVSGTNAITLTSGGTDGVGAATVSVLGTGATAAISAPISGTDGLYKIGAGTLIVSGNNSYSGGTTLAAGVLSISDESNIGGLTTAINFNGGVLQVRGTGISNLDSHTVNWGSFNGGFDISSAANTFTISQSLGGAGSLIKAGAGTLVLSGANDYLGGTTISGGVLRSDSAQAIPVGTNLTISNGLLNLNGNSATVFFVDMTGGTIDTGSGTLSVGHSNPVYTSNSLGPSVIAGTIALQNTINNWNTFQVPKGPSAIDLIVSAKITGGTNSVYKDDPGVMLVTSTASDFTGMTFIRLGTLLVGANSPQGGPGPLGSDTNFLSLGDFLSWGDRSLLTNGPYTIGRNIHVDIGQAGNPGRAILGGSTPDLSNFAGNIDLSHDLSLTAASGGTVQVSGIISGGNGVQAIGSGLVVLTSPNTYSGNTTVSGGTLDLSAGEIYSNNNWQDRIVTITNGATLRVGGWADGDAFGLGQVGFSAANIMVDNGTIEYTGGAPNGDADRAFTIGAGGATLVASGSATWQITNAGRDGQYGFASNGGLLTLTGAQNGYISKVIPGSGGLTKTGTGTWTLAGDNSYLGPTNVNNGILALAGANEGGIGRIPVGSAVSVNNNGTLRVDSDNTLGGYTLAGIPTVTINAGGKMTALDGVTCWLNNLVLAGGELASGTPSAVFGGWGIFGTVDVTGNAPSTLSAQAVTLNGSAVFTVENGATLDVTGTIISGILTKNGPGQMILSNANSYGGGTVVEDGTLIAAVSGALPDGTSLTVGTDAMTIFGSSSAGAVSGFSGSRMVTAVPEPGTFLLLTAAGVIVAAGAWQARTRARKG